MNMKKHFKESFMELPALEIQNVSLKHGEATISSMLAENVELELTVSSSHWNALISIFIEEDDIAKEEVIKTVKFVQFEGDL
jgi:hypothetical protein